MSAVSDNLPYWASTDNLPESQRLALDQSLSDEDFAKALDQETPLDAGIVRAVRVMLGRGVECFESCEGGEGHAFPEPTVRFGGGPSAGWRAVWAAQEVALPIRALRRVWSVIDGEPTGPDWELVFSQKL